MLNGALLSRYYGDAFIHKYSFHLLYVFSDNRIMLTILGNLILRSNCGLINLLHSLIIDIG